MSKLEELGKIMGLGNRIILGYLIGYLNNVTPDQCYEDIRDDKSLFQGVAEGDWEKYQEMAKGAHAEEILNKEVLIETLRKYRLDLLGVIINHPGGQDWFARQIAEVREKLQLT